MRVNIKRGNVGYYCTSEEQLALFLSKGYEVVEDKPKTTRQTKTTTKKN